MTTDQLLTDLATVAAKIAAIVIVQPDNGRVSLSIHDLGKLEKMFRRAADVIQHQQQKLQDQEAQMGKTADSINQLESALTAAQANSLDAVDWAAIAGVPAFLANLSGGSASQQSSGQQSSGQQSSGQQSSGQVSAGATS